MCRVYNILQPLCFAKFVDFSVPFRCFNTLSILCHFTSAPMGGIVSRIDCIMDSQLSKAKMRCGTEHGVAFSSFDALLYRLFSLFNRYLIDAQVNQ